MLTQVEKNNWNTIYWKPQYYTTNVNTRSQNAYRVNKEMHDCKEDYITISQKPRLGKNHSRKLKSKQIITEYRHEQYI